MRISRHISAIALLSLGLGLTTAYALDGRKSPDSNPDIPGVGAVVKQTPPDARVVTVPSDATTILPASGLPAVGLNAAVKALEIEANNGNAVAAWKLGRMYADGLGGVDRNPVLAFHYFHLVVQGRDNDQVRELKPVVADASVQLGLYYLKGIPHSDIRSDPGNAYKLFSYAASYLNDGDAQFYLGRMYLDGQGVARDPKLAEKWFKLAATSGQYEAQVRYGSLLIQGNVFTRDVTTGLMWLMVALDTAPEGDAREAVRSIYSVANEQATRDERAAAETLYDRWRPRLVRTAK